MNTMRVMMTIGIQGALRITGLYGPVDPNCHCERSEAIPIPVRTHHWIASSLRSSQ
jgi:hypothetical protein